MKKFITLIAATTIISTLNVTFSHAKNYHLFNPTPKNKMRQISVERPSKSDSINTLDAGHFMVETSFIDYKREKENSTKSDNFDIFGATTLRIGLTQNQEIQFIADLYRHHRQKSARLIERDGFNDINIRFKQNILGNDGQKYGLAIIPFIKIPTNQNNLGNKNYEGGITAPLNINFEDFSLTLQSGIAFLKEVGNYEVAYTNVATIGKNITAKTAIFAEIYFYKENFSDSKWQNTADFGISYAINENLIIDGAINLGISKYADDFNILSGFAYRF